VGHTWYREKFVAPFQQQLPSVTRFIPATIHDNSFTNPEYRATLAALTGWQKRAWLEGDWDIAAGQFFTTFRRESHVVDEFNDHRAVEWVAALDYGFNHYTVVLLGAYDSDRNLYIVDEHAARGWVIERHAEAIKKMLQGHRVSLRAQGRFSVALSRFVAGSDLFARQANGHSIASQYGELGINLRSANMDRVNGWAAIHKGLGDTAAGVAPTLFFHRRCTRLIETLPSLQHDPNRPEDVLKVNPDDDGIGGDDAADALRYLVASPARRIVAGKLRGL
jgi:phage terminase large subunit